MAGKDIDDKELAGLSPEEREALENEENDEQEGEDGGAEDEGEGADKRESKDKGDDDKGDKDAEEDDAEDDDEKADAQEGKGKEPEGDAGKDADKDDGKEGDKAGDEGKDDDEPEQQAQAPAEDDDTPPFVPTLKVEPVEDYDGKMSALDKRESEAEAKFKAGEMEFDAFRAEQRKVDAERTSLRDAKLKADMAEAQNIQTAQQAWEWEINRFYRSTQRREGIDYRSNKILNGALDAEVKALAADEANADKDSGWFLRQAHENVKKALGLDKLKARAEAGDEDAKRDLKAEGEGEGKSKGKDAEKKAAKAAAERRPNRKKLAPDIGSVPQADDSPEDSGNDEFAHLDKLSGIDLENALAKMPKDKADRYLRGS